MAQLPDYVKIVLAGYSDEPEPDIIESRMARGVSKTRIGNTKISTKIGATLLFTRREDSVAFVQWWRNTIKRAGWFDVRDPHTRAVKSMRFVGGSIGSAVPVAGNFSLVQRQVTLEYYE